ncbi:MAG TPA: C-type lectin domain-containing protein [Candidatus Sulfotelmatobacter sp.]|nr:C-type lectin domain-containing protein [Candidatus Sulfotelmatobacter sp.]
MLMSLSGWAKPLSSAITNPGNQHSYILLEKATWKDSETEAIALGGHLATIRNQAEEDWLLKTFGNYQGQQHLLWIGLSDTEKKFHFSWSSGESVSYTAWAPGEPNNVGNAEDFVAIYYPNHDQRGKWNDWKDRTEDPIGLPMNGVVEIIPSSLESPAAADSVTVEINPTLVITNDSGSIKLQWPVSGSNYVLEATPDLSQPFTMFGYSETTDLESGILTVAISNSTPRMFFRLHKP